MGDGGSAMLGALLGNLLQRDESLAVAESLTGGELAARLSAPPGASAVFVGGVVSYATSVKVAALGVPAPLVERFGVISAPCAAAMAAGARSRLGADWGLSTTGVAGPTRQEGHGVGTVFVGIAGPSGVSAHRLALTGERAEIRTLTCDHALELLAAAVADA